MGDHHTFMIGGVKFEGSSHEEAHLRALHEQAKPVEPVTPVVESVKEAAEAHTATKKHLGGKKK